MMRPKRLMARLMVAALGTYDSTAYRQNLPSAHPLA